MNSNTIDQLARPGLVVHVDGKRFTVHSTSVDSSGTRWLNLDGPETLEAISVNRGKVVKVDPRDVPGLNSPVPMQLTESNFQFLNRPGQHVELDGKQYTVKSFAGGPGHRYLCLDGQKDLVAIFAGGGRWFRVNLSDFPDLPFPALEGSVSSNETKSSATSVPAPTEPSPVASGAVEWRPFAADQSHPPARAVPRPSKHVEAALWDYKNAGQWAEIRLTEEVLPFLTPESVIQVSDGTKYFVDAICHGSPGAARMTLGVIDRFGERWNLDLGQTVRLLKLDEGKVPSDALGGKPASTRGSNAKQSITNTGYGSDSRITGPELQSWSQILPGQFVMWRDKTGEHAGEFVRAEPDASKGLIRMDTGTRYFEVDLDQMGMSVFPCRRPIGLTGYFSPLKFPDVSR